MPAALSWAIRKTAFRRRQTEPASRRASTRWRIGRARSSSICMQRVERRELGVVVVVAQQPIVTVAGARAASEASAAPVRVGGDRGHRRDRTASVRGLAVHDRDGVGVAPAGELALDASGQRLRRRPGWPPWGSGRAACRAPAARS